MTEVVINASNRNDIENTHRPVGILHGLGHAGDPLHWLVTIMMDARSNDQRRWILDTRRSRYPVALVELACFANQVRSHPKQFSNLAIAWVEESPMSCCMQSYLKSLPLAFHEFDNFDAALCWLHEES